MIVTMFFVGVVEITLIVIQVVTGVILIKNPIPMMVGGTVVVLAGVVLYHITNPKGMEPRFCLHAFTDWEWSTFDQGDIRHCTKCPMEQVSSDMV